MNFLLDTNAVSEWVKPRPNVGAIRWMQEADEDRIFLSVISLAELRYGIDRTTQGARRSRLNRWLQDELLLRFEGRILGVDERVAARWGEIVSLGEAIGCPVARWMHSWQRPPKSTASLSSLAM